FYSTKQLFLELDMDDPSVMAKTMLQMNMKNDTTLKQLLPPLQYDSVSAAFKKLTGMSVDMMQTMKPELLETIIYPSMLGCTGAEAWEQKFMQMAKANNMKINGLEQVEDQLKIFDEIPYTIQAKEFAETVLNIDSVKKSFNDMLTLYKQKDLNGLNKMMNSEDEFSDYSDLLLKNRNEKWIPEIIEQAKLKPTFFAFGAAHLGNDVGVINLLRKQGYTVTPVTY
ncbi:MAG: TraB/GumN family protein, partial [Parafilimonas sp.]